MNKDLFTVREEEIFKALKELQNCDFVIIGGYAVNAYTLPRFSVDCDMIIKDENELRKIEVILLKLGYKATAVPHQAPYSGGFYRYEKEVYKGLAVSMDILVQSVSDRGTRVVFLADWVFANSKIRVLKGKTINEELKLRIINSDALIVMKAIFCRQTDIRDVFMMLPNARDKAWIKSEISARYSLNDRLSKIMQLVNSRQFKDGLFGVYGQFDLKTFEKHMKELESLRES